MAYSCRVVGKSSWPELRGYVGESVVGVIEQENPHVRTIMKLDDGSDVHDYRCDRVVVWINEIHLVTRVPVVG